MTQMTMDRDDLVKKFTPPAQVPGHLHDGLVLYLVDGIPPGDFLIAVLANDLKETIARGDDDSLEGLVALVRWLFQVCPGGAWGSRERVRAWIDMGGSAAWLK